MGRGPFRFPLRVRFGDVDHAGIVYYPRFFEYFHTAFEEMIDAVTGGDYRQMVDGRHIGFPAVHVQTDFKKPLRFGDQIEIEVTSHRVGQKSVTLKYRALKDGELHAESYVTCACMDMTQFRSMLLPDDLRQAFESLV